MEIGVAVELLAGDHGRRHADGGVDGLAGVLGQGLAGQLDRAGLLDVGRPWHRRRVGVVGAGREDGDPGGDEDQHDHCTDDQEGPVARIHGSSSGREADEHE